MSLQVGEVWGGGLEMLLGKSGWRKGLHGPFRVMGDVWIVC